MTELPVLIAVIAGVMSVVLSIVVMCDDWQRRRVHRENARRDREWRDQIAEARRNGVPPPPPPNVLIRR